ncbi:MAG: hypothetical protein QM765_51870 [Myxococcales bacterium]
MNEAILELLAPLAVLHPAAGQPQALAGSGAREAADRRHQPRAVGERQLDHREAVLGVGEDHLLEDALEGDDTGRDGRREERSGLVEARIHDRECVLQRLRQRSAGRRPISGA